MLWVYADIAAKSVEKINFFRAYQLLDMHTTEISNRQVQMLELYLLTSGLTRANPIYASYI
ncbi:CLUMA_CG017390, isoform A [Clunio marinus]|uniref:CLUMA_CG017390, isoform A n=1 Tax=Clunio marinus TaxID=568069 RepID=A0A1J1IXJ3_9DIPT|nr:CLUMA_CG017390, isoform A [Clunio marinus]